MSICHINCALYNKIKDLIVVDHLDKNLCSNDCYYTYKKICICRLFNEPTPYSKRCKNCVDIFGG